MDRHRAHGHARIGPQPDQQVPAEHGREIEHQGRNRDRRQFDDQIDQLHHDLEQALQGLLKRIRGRRLGHDHADAEDQGEHHHRQDLVLGRGGDDIGRDHVEEELARLDRFGRIADNGRGPLGPLGQQLLRQDRIDADTGAEIVDHAQADADRDGRDEDGEHQGLEAYASQRFQIAHLGDADGQRREQQRQNQHEQKAQEDLADGLDDVHHPGKDLEAHDVDVEPPAHADGKAQQHPQIERHPATFGRFHMVPLQPVPAAYRIGRA